MKIAVTLEYEDEKIQFHSNRLLLFLLLKKLTALSDTLFNFMHLTAYSNPHLAKPGNILLIFENGVDPDQLASRKPAGQNPHCLPFCL